MPDLPEQPDLSNNQTYPNARIQPHNTDVDLPSPSSGPTRKRMALTAGAMLGIGLALMGLWLGIGPAGSDDPVNPLEEAAVGDSHSDQTSPLVAAPPDSSPAGSPEPRVDAPPATEPSVEAERRERPLPDSPSAMIAAIDEAELAVRDPGLTDERLDSWGRRQQGLYRQLSFHPDWIEEVAAGVDPTIRRAVGLNLDARRNLSALVNTESRHDELPAWRVVAPLPPQTLMGYYKRAEAEYGIPWEFLAAINLVETRMGRIEGVSSAGAIGPMQFLPTTWAECCQGDPSEAADAIAGAAKYLNIRGGPEDMSRAIFGYNNSDYYVDAVTAYATVMMENERAYYGYHGWEIYFLTTEGLIRIPVGYNQLEPIAATAWLIDHPETLFSH